MFDSLATTLRNFFSRALQIAYPDVKIPPLEVTRSTQESFGNYQFNSAMKLAASLKVAPRKIAEEIVKAAVTLKEPFIERLEVAGPGFINIWLAPEYLAAMVQAALQDLRLGIRAVKKEKVVIDFSSPNTAKEMHVGHLRSTIIGDSLARVFEFLGHDVLRLNHIGDFGTSFGMLIAYMKENTQYAFNQVDEISLSDLVTFYRQSKVAFDADPEFKKRAQLQVVALQSGDPETVKIWKIICEISRRAYQEIYDLLDIKIVERGESFYNFLLPFIVDEFERKGLITPSEGAKCIFIENAAFVNREGEKLPLMIQKSDGGYNYDTTDLAAMYHRIGEEKAERIIIVTDAGQATHFQMVYEAAVMAGYLDKSKVRFDHVPFGVVLGADGKKFRTRSGDTEKLIDLLTTAVSRAEDILKERNPDWSGSERKKVAQALGIGAVKYADLSSNRTSDYTFSYERMLRFEGNTVAFVMYAYVRSLSIKRKISADIEDLIKNEKIILKEPAEIALALHLDRFSEMIEQIVEELLPNRLTDYLYELAEKFNLFFRDCRVEGDPAQNSRILLTEACGRVFEKGFSLLGVQCVKRM